METRIREFRKLRGLTLKELADKISTTPQTVQRLETANMTVSTDWLEKIANALNIEPADLIARPGGREIPVIGRVMQHGRVLTGEGKQINVLHLHVPADDPVAAQLDVRVGLYDAGTILVANRLKEADRESAHGADCLVELKDGQVRFTRVIRSDDGGWTLVPHDAGSEIIYNAETSWIAPVVMSLRYF
jgi:transcriptional regulator with XRE-family HTH domain